MISLNLLPEELKLKIRQQRLYFLFLKTEIILLLIIAAGGISFFAAGRILSANILKFRAETSIIIKTSGSDYVLEAKKINETLSTVSKIQKGFFPYSPLLTKVSALAPDGVSFSYLKINTPAKALKIRGLALTRENFLILEKNLKNASFLTKVNIPLADKIEKDNIDFDIDLEFDLTKL